MQVIVCVGTLRLWGEVVQVLCTVCHTHKLTRMHTHAWDGGRNVAT